MYERPLALSANEGQSAFFLNFAFVGAGLARPLLLFLAV
jgi:hypothetical protein